ncbi:hypothetical protein GOBAR_AA04490 [Gossypium barbadense]|uniref:Uncharacterized protein n=1 Tax=Gossypium barbadense TaxID=3634 RepID=A0A2P5YKF8_GOSBA|nr:hypothetical protein GOBAR_AA04490 [Gossypium barbadense]
MTLKNQNASIQGLKTQIGQLTKLISEQPQGSLPSNTESNPREQLNVISIHDEEGLVERPSPEPVVSKGKNEVGQNKQKSIPNAVKILKELLANKQKLDERLHVELNEEISSKDTHELCSIHNKESTHEERNVMNRGVGDKVSLDAAYPHIDTAKPNEEIPRTVLSIFPFGIVEAHGRALGRVKTGKNFPQHGMQ